MAKRSIKRNSRAVALLACIALAIALLPATASAEGGPETGMPLAASALGATRGSSGQCGDNLTWVLDDSGTLTISGTGEIWAHVFSDNDSIKKVVIENGVTSIGDNAFNGCVNLEGVTIPSGVTSIGNFAFYECSSLKSVTIPDGVTSIGLAAFYECSSLKSVSIPGSVTSIGDYVFYGCESLGSVTIPDSVTHIGLTAFSACDNLKDVYYGGTPDKWNSIKTAFATTNPTVHFVCGDAVYYTLDGGTLTISKEGNGTGEMDVWGSSDVVPWHEVRGSIKEVDIGDGVTGIGNYAFAGCTSLESVTIPDSVTFIADAAFGGCTFLASVEIPDGVKAIGKGAFEECRKLASVEIPSGVTSIGESAFAWCTSLTSVEIPSGVTSIGESAFAWCTSLTSVTIPGSVESIWDAAFDCCEELASVNYVGAKEGWDKIGKSETWNRACPYGPKVYCLPSVDVAAVPSGGGVVERAYSLKEQDAGKTGSVTVKASPNAGYAFKEWKGGPVDGEAESEVSFGVGPFIEYGSAESGYSLTAQFASPLTITAKDQEYVYNGQTQGPGDKAYIGAAQIADVAIVNGLQPGDSLASMILDGQGQAVGSSPLVPGNAVVKNTAGEDVTGNYDIEYVNGTLTIKAEPAEEYTVKFVNYDGAVLQSGKVAKGQVPKYEGVEPTRPETAECTYEFAGWDPEVAAVTGDATYKATYAEKAKKGVYEAVSGAGSSWTQGSNDPLVFTFKRTADDGTTFGHFAGILVDGKAVPEKDSSGRANWTAAKGSVVVSLQPSYLATLPAGAHTVAATFDDGDPATADFTVSAPATHTVTFDANGHGKAPDAQEVEHGKKAKKPSNPTADGYTFGGWYTDKDCKEAYDFSAPVTEDVTLYAKWTKKSSSGSGTSPKTGDPLAGAFAIALALAAASALALAASRRMRRG